MFYHHFLGTQLTMEKLLKDAYFAGLIDGEAYLALEKRGNGVRPTISVDMTCEKTIRALHDHFKVGTMRSKNVTKPNRKPKWRWRALYFDAVFVTKEIFPYLITKKPNAELILSHVPKKKGRPIKAARPLQMQD